MQDIIFTIKEYEHSHKLVQDRIHELNAQISKSKSCKEDSGTKGLLERRCIMYMELWDIEYALREMREYVTVLSAPEVEQRVV